MNRVIHAVSQSTASADLCVISTAKFNRSRSIDLSISIENKPCCPTGSTERNVAVIVDGTCTWLAVLDDSEGLAIENVQNISTANIELINSGTDVEGDARTPAANEDVPGRGPKIIGEGVFTPVVRVVPVSGSAKPMIVGLTPA